MPFQSNPDDAAPQLSNPPYYRPSEKNGGILYLRFFSDGLSFEIGAQLVFV